MEVSQAMRGPDDLPAQTPDVQDLIIVLLHTAVQAGGSLECIEWIAGRCPAAAAGPVTDLAEARRLMSGARSTLIRCADELVAGLSSR